MNGRTPRCGPTILLAAVGLLLPACAPDAGPPAADAGGGGAEQAATDAPGAPIFEPGFSLGADRTHARFSAAIEPALSAPSGAVVEVFTEEASDGQLGPESTTADVPDVSFDPIHPLTGPVFVEGAEPGDVLAVTLLEMDVGDWGWAGIFRSTVKVGSGTLTRTTVRGLFADAKGRSLMALDAAT